jgi:hypothetical protein
MTTSRTNKEAPTLRARADSQRPSYPDNLVADVNMFNVAAIARSSGKQYVPDMNERAEACRAKAQHCERAGSLAVTLDVRLMYADLAQQWRELAKQIELPEQQTATTEGL